MAKPNVPEMQNPYRENMAARKTLEKASVKLPGDIATP